MSTPTTLLVGSGGLLGSAVTRQLEGGPLLTPSVPWSEDGQALPVLARSLDDLLAREEPWRVIWCAGAGVVATGEDALLRESEVWEAFLAALAERLDAASALRGSVFVASSAGGVYAGSGMGPYNEDTEPCPTSPYGRTKLRAEGAAEHFGRRTGVPVVVGRIANLYGPGQDLGKKQGLVSQLCLNHLLRRPSNIFVSLDTARDYLFVDDAARMVVRTTELAAREGGVTTKVLASERSVTIGAILGELRRATGRRPQIVLGTSPSAPFQPPGLVFRSTQWPELLHEVRTTLAAGTLATMESVRRALQQGQLAR